MFPIRIEIIPSEGIVERVKALVPLTTTLTVTCLPHHGIERTMRAAVQLSVLGYNVIPHLAARSLHSRAELTGILRDCDVAGIGEVFVIGGDRKQPAGPYESALPVLEDIAQYSGGMMRAGVAGYPEGHPSVGPVDVLDALLAKQHLASHVVTQMCFSAPKILDYAALLRREGVQLPVWAGRGGVRSADQAGLPGHADRRRKFPEVPEPQGPAGPQTPERRPLLATKPGGRAGKPARQHRGHPSLQLQQP